MMVKFHGGSPTSADYLLADRGSSGEVRDQVEVLRGDPEVVQAVADGLDFEHKYTAGVIAWGPEDRPTREQIGEVLDEFEKTAWAGLERDRYAWTAVAHRHGDQTHVHVLAARVDLQTGKSLNIAPPPAGGRRSIRSETGRTTGTAGPVRTIRTGRGSLPEATKPIATRRNGESAMPQGTGGRRSPPTSSSGSSPARSGTGRASSRPSRRSV